jgi:hypothetical protein
MEELLARFTQPARQVNRRKYHQLRELVDAAKPLPKATLMWEARKIGPDNLATLEAKIASGDMRPQGSETVPYPNIRKVLHSATLPQKSAILWMAAKLEPDDLVDLDGQIERSALAGSTSAQGHRPRREHEARP